MFSLSPFTGFCLHFLLLGQAPQCNCVDHRPMSQTITLHARHQHRLVIIEVNYTSNRGTTSTTRQPDNQTTHWLLLRSAPRASEYPRSRDHCHHHRIRCPVFAICPRSPRSPWVIHNLWRSSHRHSKYVEAEATLYPDSHIRPIVKRYFDDGDALLVTDYYTSKSVCHCLISHTGEML